MEGHAMRTQSKLPIIVTASWLPKATVIDMLILWVIFIVYSINRADYKMIPVLLMLILVTLLLLIFMQSSIRIDEETITMITPTGRSQIRWDEVRTIKARASYITLEGNDKRLVLAVPTMSKNTDAMAAYFAEQVKERNILMVSDVKSPLTGKNTRIGRS
jgi:hypothetical protein